MWADGRRSLLCLGMVEKAPQRRQYQTGSFRIREMPQIEMYRGGWGADFWQWPQSKQILEGLRYPILWGWQVVWVALLGSGVMRWQQGQERGLEWEVSGTRPPLKQLLIGLHSFGFSGFWNAPKSA